MISPPLQDEQAPQEQHDKKKMKRQRTQPSSNPESSGTTSSSYTSSSEDDDWRNGVEEVGPKSDRFVLGKKLGEGAFGAVFQGTQTSTGLPVAVKIEGVENMTGAVEEHSLKLLTQKVQMTQAWELNQLRVPVFCWTGMCKGEGRVLVMPMFGPNLHDVTKRYNKQHQLPGHLAVAVAMEALTGLEQIQHAKIVHRDIKPENMLFGLSGKGAAGRVFQVDFGLATVWNPAKDKEKAVLAERGLLPGKAVGTARYTSTHTHRGAPPAPRDDLESVAYVLLGLLRGGTKPLPWVGAAGNARGKKRFARVAKAKRLTPIRTLAEGIPDQRAAAVAISLLRTARTHPFTQPVDYARLRDMLQEYLNDVGHGDKEPSEILLELHK